MLLIKVKLSSAKPLFGCHGNYVNIATFAKICEFMLLFTLFKHFPFNFFNKLRFIKILITVKMTENLLKLIEFQLFGAS